jgi:hypothetical protein
MAVLTSVRRSALALVLLSGTAVACSNASPAQPSASPVAATSSAPPSPSPSAGTPAVTLKEAGRALDAFLATDDVVRAGMAERWTIQLTRDGQRPITIAQFHSTGMKPPRYTWGHRRLLVPRQEASQRTPQWFAATVERRDSAGHTRTAVLTFIRQNTDARWQTSFESLLYPGERLPAVKVDAEGYATALDSRDQSVAITPNLMGPLHATVAEEGSKGFASGLIAPGPQTTGYFAEIGTRRETAREEDCMNYDSIFAAAADYPVLALRTDGGGALVLYTLIRTSTWSPVLNCGYGRPLAIPKEARWDLDDPVVRRERRILETQQYVSLVPPKTSIAPAQVIGYDGLVTKASTS